MPALIWCAVALSPHAAIDTMADMDSLMAEMIDRFGPVPEEVRNLIDTIQIKILCRQANVSRVDAGPKGLSLSFRDNHFSNPEALIGYIAGKAGQVQLTGDHRCLQEADFNPGLCCS